MPARCEFECAMIQQFIVKQIQAGTPQRDAFEVVKDKLKPIICDVAWNQFQYDSATAIVSIRPLTKMHDTVIMDEEFFMANR